MVFGGSEVLAPPAPRHAMHVAAAGLQWPEALPTPFAVPKSPGRAHSSPAVAPTRSLERSSTNASPVAVAPCDSDHN